MYELQNCVSEKLIFYPKILSNFSRKAGLFIWKSRIHVVQTISRGDELVMRKISYFILLAAMMIFVAGCGFLNAGQKEDIDPPQDVTYEEAESILDDEEATDEEEGEPTISTELYLIDRNGFVVPRTFTLPNTESVAKQALEYLVTGGPLENDIPADFRTVLPAGTEMTVNIENGLATVDFNKAFTEYAPEDEMRILQAVTWTLTQFDTINRVKLQLNGNELKEMPVGGTPIPEHLTRQIGINYDHSDVVDITNTRPTTVYYIAQNDHEAYYVPVTKRIRSDAEDFVTAVVNELVKGPGLESNLYTLLMPDVELVEEPEIKDGIVTLNFNENILSSYDQKIIAQGVLDAIVLTLTEHEEIEGVAIQVNGEEQVLNQEGEPLTSPVTRPKHLNTGSL